jgi:shikimate dehydrogenase
MHKKRQFGLLGRHLVHSFSPAYFSDKFEAEEIVDAQYDLFPIEQITDFPTLLAEQPTLRGLNVTIPYKEAVIPFLDDLDPLAKRVGAVNTIKFIKGKKIGFNTDVIGFKEACTSFLEQMNNRALKALILGTGGASKAVKVALEDLNIPYKFVSRTKTEDVLSYDEVTVNILREHLFVINTTPLGMYPAINEVPSLPYEGLTAQHFLFDLIYNPTITKFLEEGQRQEAFISNGLLMLQKQADKSWQIWNEK